ncbi:MAG: tRNA (adenosine(37)-N6)-threonylcarbamoyltransferase complex ATPase subunit type 1 TsaE [Magnetococcales bacterium]|nr:tRNA (adenosine(37)-N6)-threonylcarbamoyltransferase complex ATPase subunit type 1 TsaE [Magnetococcales bacterium]
MIYVTGSEAETEALASELARCLMPGMALLLTGDLGSGKSVFARGVLRGLGVEEAYITSPTFTLVNVYDEGRLPVAHFDLYRVTDPEELELVGIEEYVDGKGVVIVEWPELGAGHHFGAALDIRLTDAPEKPEQRRITLTPLEPLSRECLHVFKRQRAPSGP